MQPLKIEISLKELIHAFEERCEFLQYYLDRETGEIIPQSEHVLPGAVNDFPVGGAESDYEKIERFILIPSMTPAEALSFIRGFENILSESSVSGILQSSHSAHDVFSIFKKLIADRMETAKEWDVYYYTRMKIIVESWLVSQGIDFSCLE